MTEPSLVTEHPELRARARRTIADLNAMGLGRGDVIAVVADPEPAARAGLLIAAGATAALIAPDLRYGDYGVALAEVGARAVAVPIGSRSAVLAAATDGGYPLLWLLDDDRLGAGTGTSIGGLTLASRPGPAGLDDLAVIHWRPENRQHWGHRDLARGAACDHPGLAGLLTRLAASE